MNLGSIQELFPRLSVRYCWSPNFVMVDRDWLANRLSPPIRCAPGTDLVLLIAYMCPHSLGINISSSVFCTSGKETVENLKILRGRLAPCQEKRIKRQQTVSSAGCKVLVPNAGFLLASMPYYFCFKPIECSYSEPVCVSVAEDKIRESPIVLRRIQQHWPWTVLPIECWQSHALTNWIGRRSFECPCLRIESPQQPAPVLHSFIYLETQADAWKESKLIRTTVSGTALEHGRKIDEETILTSTAETKQNIIFWHDWGAANQTICGLLYGPAWGLSIVLFGGLPSWSTAKQCRRKSCQFLHVLHWG